MKTITVEEFYRAKKKILELEWVSDEGCDMSRPITNATISNPGLVLAGFHERFASGRLQVLGETEIQYIESLDHDRRTAALDAFLSRPMPAVIVTKGQTPPAELVSLAARHAMPLFLSQLKTGEFYRRLQPYLEEQFAPATNMHGSLADVYGVGLLFIGRSGIGKSECVLDLVERGHRLVADDVVMVTRRGNDILIGRGHELQRHHMEIRGIGIIDIKALFGIRAIRQQKRIEVVVQLVDWDEKIAYDRTGMDIEEIPILGVDIPKVIIPLNTGKNITVISEVIAMNHLLKYSGVHSARRFNESLVEAMQPVRQYLEGDYE